MKKQLFYKWVIRFFLTVGILSFFCIPLLILTNTFGISSMVSVIETIKSQSLYHPSGKMIMEGMMEGAANVIGDPYTEYYSEEEWKEINKQSKLKLSGIGVQLMMQPDGSLMVTATTKGGPAERMGIKNGDIIIQIDDVVTVGMGGEEAVSHLRGEENTTVNVKTYRPSDKGEYSFKIKRKIIKTSTIEIVELEEEPHIGYISFSQFTEKSYEEMTAALEKVKDKEGIILDLRDNPGGEFYAAIKIADLFLNEGIIVKTIDAKNKEKIYEAHGGSNEQPVVLLVNGNSASSAEVLAAALRDNDRAVLVGEKTYGKGIIQALYPLRSGGAIKLTMQEYTTPKGANIHQMGIFPDYEVEGLTYGQQDQQLLKAIEVIKARGKEVE